MPRNSNKSQYKKKGNRIIYILRSPIGKEFYINHCQHESLMPIFRQHCAGQRFQTSTCLNELKLKGLLPCLYILDEIYATPVEAYSHVIAWTKIMIDAGYTSLNQGSIMDYIEDLYEKSELIYNKNKVKNLQDICNCSKCIVSHYRNKRCPLYAGE